jgi:hypothetical protein
MLTVDSSSESPKNAVVEEPVTIEPSSLTSVSTSPSTPNTAVMLSFTGTFTVASQSKSHLSLVVSLVPVTFVLDFE